MLSIKGLASLLSILLDYDEIPKFKNPISSRDFLHAKSAENYSRWLGNLNA
jgi:acetyl-CoA carboxylase beta subunit